MPRFLAKEGTIAHQFGRAATLTTDLTVTTTSETVLADTEFNITFEGQTPTLWIGFLELTTGAGTTAVTTRIRSNATGDAIGTGDTLLTEANAVTIVSAAGGTNVYFVLHSALSFAGFRRFGLTVQQTGATGNGTVLYATLSCIPLE